jgi:thiol-disulfide isomerase/thioredoxin
LWSFVRRRRNTILVAAAAVVVAIYGPRMCRSDLLAPGTPAPEFAVEVAGAFPARTIRASDLRGRPAVLFFWTAWCPHCKPMLRDLDQLARERPAVRVVAIHSDAAVDPSAVERFARAYPGLVVAHDGDRLLHPYRVRSFPTTYVLTPEGKICGGHPGRTGIETLRRDLDRCGAR